MPHIFRLTTLLLLLCALAACSTPYKYQQINDVQRLEQDASLYHGLSPNKPLIAPGRQAEFYAFFLKEHFGPWHREAAATPADHAFWALKKYESREIFGDNTLPRHPDWMGYMNQLSKTDEYPSMALPAIAVADIALRAVPSAEPIFDDFDKAGEGYPFDYNQNSLVPAGTPLLVTHISADGAWMLVECRFAFGWAPVREVAFADQAFRDKFESESLAAITVDGISIFGLGGDYLLRGRIGQTLPLATPAVQGEALRVQVPVRDENGDATIREAELSRQQAELMPLPPTPAQFAHLADSLMFQEYGWGGMYGKRDCSALTMDILTPFGIALPRNSKPQSFAGIRTEVAEFDTPTKKRLLMDMGIPFLTLVRKPGHIMLYIGTAPTEKGDGKEPVVLHATWGIKTKKRGKEGRKVIGATVITTLEPGRELPDLAPGALLIDSVRAYTIPEPGMDGSQE